jgi:hypothetical protein
MAAIGEPEPRVGSIGMTAIDCDPDVSLNAVEDPV